MDHSLQANKIQKNGQATQLLLCGISHHSASLAEREMFQLNRNEIPRALKLFLSLEGVTEVVLLSTCNRFEAYFCLQGSEQRAIDVIRKFYQEFRQLDIEPYEHLFYSRHASSVVRHLCRVTAGMDSLVLGETQIQGQVKESYSVACSLKTPGRVLHKTFHTAFRAGKGVRTQTAIGQGQHSVAGEAIAILKENLSPEDAILIIGVNQNTKLAAKCLFDAGYHNLTFANRSKYKAEKLAARFDAVGIGLTEIQNVLNKTRALISCTGAQQYIITADQVQTWRDKQKGTLFIVDMAVPRDVDTSKTFGKDFKVIDLQDLKNYLELQNLERKSLFPMAEQMIEKEVSTFQAWLETSDDPLLGDIAEKFEQIRQRNLSEVNGEFTPEDLQKIDHITRKLTRQLIGVPRKYLELSSKK